MPLFNKSWFQGLSEKSRSLRGRAKDQLTHMKEFKVDKSIFSKTATWVKANPRDLAKGVVSLALVVGITLGGHQYVQAHMKEVYHVFVSGQAAGTISSPELLDTYRENRKAQIAKDHPDVKMVLHDEGITYTPERTFHVEPNDEEAIKKLDELVVAQAVGVELRIDGKLFGIVKDQETADSLLEQFKQRYLPKGKESGTVQILSADAASMKDLNVGEPRLQTVDFVQKVETPEVVIKEAGDLINPEELLKKLETGGVQPTKYTVEPGDCVGCIAKKFGIPKALIYEKNTWIYEDQIKVGQVLDLTVLQPALSVKTVEQVVVNQEIQHDTIYEKNDSLKVGVTREIKAGHNGMKKVALQVTKVNGMVEEERVLNEEITEQPVSAVVMKGTKVILGEGTGKLAWPVVGASISSTFGYRWGKLHKGVDITGSSSILSSDNGKVVKTGYAADYGNHIIIDHLNGYRTLYGHLSKIGVSVGQIVEKGEKIGVMGSTGDSTGTHLHFEVIKSGNPENPLKYLNR